MKKIVAIAALALVSTNALAGDLGAEVRWGNETNEQAFTAAQNFNSALGSVNVGLEVETINEKAEGLSLNTYTANVGLPFTLGNLKLEPFVQAGVATISLGPDLTLVGGGLKSELVVAGPLSVGAEYRYRETVEGPTLVDERATGFVRVVITDKLSVKAVYHNQFHDIDDEQYGLGFAYKF
jgi:hypothetical protein